jgi:3-methyl-2-oxobutanoate hydroxymethyltransferase
MKDRVTIPLLRQKKERGEKIVMITCYDYPSARLLDEVNVDILFVGDSVGNNVLGYDTTIPVTIEDIIHHARSVRHGVRRALMLVDMPFLSFQVSAEEALKNAGRLMKETGAQAVKLEGGAAIAPTTARLVAAGIPVMGHIGLTPQSVHLFGGHRLQGADPHSAECLMRDACSLVEAGVFGIVLEMIPSDVARQITEAIPVPTIGIAAGPHCDGQVQVFHDLFGLYPKRMYRHARRYAEVGRIIQDAAQEFVNDVREGRFPTEEHSY